MMLRLISVRPNSQLSHRITKVFQTASSLLSNGLPPRWPSIPFLFALALVPGPAALADALQDYAAQCDQAIGVTVPDFDCDAGTEVPGQGSVFSGPRTGRSETCDEPNRLNKQCDPGSHFQVLTRSDDAYVVAHCRHEGGESGEYGDIAVIQYNRKNGATCFYQALGDQLHGNMPGGHAAPNAPEKPVKAPSNGVFPNTFWLSPSATVMADHCGSCHDNGPFIRSPYLNQVTGPNALPGSPNDTSTDAFSFNKDQPYGLVGQDFASWKAFKVEIAGNECNSCHRLGVNNISDNGTALDFAIRATAASETSKNPPSAASPIWMPPRPIQVAFNQAHADAAKAIHGCALRLHENPLPNSATCRITQFAAAYTAPPPPLPRTTARRNLIQSTFGSRGNFELLVPQGKVIKHYFRNNDDPQLAWHLLGDRQLSYFCPPQQLCVPPRSVTFIQSNFLGDGVHGNFEAIVRVASPIVTEPDHLDFWFLDSKVGKWNGPFPLMADGKLIDGVTGN